MGVESRTSLLTLRQRAILEYIQRCAERDHFPTVREIGDACEISSTGMVGYHLTRLVEYGMLTREPGKTRSLRVNAALLGSDPRNAALDAARALLDALDDHVPIEQQWELSDQLMDALARCGIATKHRIRHLAYTHD